MPTFMVGAATCISCMHKHAGVGRTLVAHPPTHQYCLRALREDHYGLLRNDGKMHELIARGTVHASTAHAPHPKRNLFMRAANFAHRHYSYRVCRSCSPNTLPSTGMHRVSPAIFLSICTSGFTSGSSCAARAFVLLLKSHPPCHDLLQASSAMRVTRAQPLSSAPRSRRDCHRSPLGRECRRLRLCVLHSIRQDVGLPARTSASFL
jgi:hypothetical protein